MEAVRRPGRAPNRAVAAAALATGVRVVFISLSSVVKVSLVFSFVGLDQCGVGRFGLASVSSNWRD